MNNDLLQSQRAVAVKFNALREKWGDRYPRVKEIPEIDLAAFDVIEADGLPELSGSELRESVRVTGGRGSPFFRM